jgi:hypothetical protein
MAFGSAIEPCQIVPDRTVGRFNQMGLRLCHQMKLWGTDPFKGQPVATVGIGADGGHMGDLGFDLAIKLYGFFNPFADDIGNNPTRVPAISSPYDGPAVFF